jgi:hypothetical protein
MGRALLLWGGGSAAAARAHASAGARIISWPGSETAALAAAGIPFEPVEQALGSEALAAVDAAARRWARVWARLPLAEGRSFRDLVSWRGESLLWATEGFLLQATAGPRCARGVELCARLFERLAPLEVDASGLGPAEVALVARAATASGVLFHGTPGRPRALAVEAPRAARRRPRLFGRRPALPAVLAGGATPRHALFVLSDTADEPRLAPLCEALRADAWLEPAVLPLAALSRWESSRARRAADEAALELAAACAALRGTPGLAAAYAHRGVGFADLAGNDLEALLCAHLPGQVRRMECALELLESARPAIVLLGVEERDARRALGMAARAAGVPWIVLGRARGDEPEEAERADFGPQPAATVSTAAQELEAAVARVRVALRGSVEAP